MRSSFAEQCELMTAPVAFAAATRHQDVQAGVVAIEPATRRAQMLKRAQHARGLAFSQDEPQADRTLAVELPVQPSPDLPAAIHVSGDDVVVRAAKRAIGAEAHAGGQHQGR